MISFTLEEFIEFCKGKNTAHRLICSKCGQEFVFKILDKPKEEPEMSLFNTCWCPIWRKPKIVLRPDTIMSKDVTVKECLKCGYKVYLFEGLNSTKKRGKKK